MNQPECDNHATVRTGLKGSHDFSSCCRADLAIRLHTCTIYDDQGRLGSWWTADDLAKYHAAAEKLVAQFNGYCPLPDLCVSGRQVLTENIADLAGLLTAHDAYVLSLKGKTDVVIHGLTGEQRFFLAFAQRWRKAQSEATLRRQIKTDIHSPGEYRSDTVRNIEAWYKAYDVIPGDKLYLKPEDRVGIW
ncbi:MAG: hypothetical protein DMG78_25865 [Acidobacteria bacterium]|nr:MAG: hypothetical protein DMG78_25865 [Acidobacteriota bacterium]